MLRMWAHLRTFSLYFLQYLPGQHTVAQIRDAQNELFCFAVLAESHLQGQLLTLLLHRAVVHIPEQAINLGPTAFHSEVWGERAVRRTKGRITGHAMRGPDKASAALCLTEMGLRLNKCAFPYIDGPLDEAEELSTPNEVDKLDVYGVQLMEGYRAASTGYSEDEVCFAS